MAAPQSAMDDEIAAPCLQLEDLSKDDDDPGGFGDDLDEITAIYREEVEQRLSILRDRKHAQSIARAVISDTATITYLLTQDRQVRADRNIALQMSELPLTIEAAPQVSQTMLDFDIRSTHNL